MKKETRAILDKVLFDKKYRKRFKRVLRESIMRYDDFILFDEYLYPIEFFMDLKNRGFSNDYIIKYMPELYSNYLRTEEFKDRKIKIENASKSITNHIERVSKKINPIPNVTASIDALSYSLKQIQANSDDLYKLIKTTGWTKEEALKTLKYYGMSSRELTDQILKDINFYKR